MADMTDRFRIYPKYTTMIGTAATYTAPMDVRAYAQAILTGWQGTGLGMMPATIEYTVQQSMNLEDWTDIATVSPDAGLEETVTVYFTLAWIRIKTVVTGDDPGVMTWLMGEFVRRDSAGGSA